jgi:hypothetical protein
MAAKRSATSCRRGKLGHEAFDREEHSLGLYPTAPAAANAVFAAAKNERAAG